MSTPNTNGKLLTDKQVKEMEANIDSFLKKAEKAGITTQEIRTVIDDKWILALTRSVEEQDWYQDILNFHKEFEHHIEPFPRLAPERVRALRSKLIREEVNELLDGLDDGDLVKLADGAADSIVVILGTCVSYGIDLRPVWDEVHESNMTKKGGGKRADGKTLKPEGWQPPRIKELLDEQRA